MYFQIATSIILKKKHVYNNNKVSPQNNELIIYINKHKIEVVS